jgi:hypothetical protein
MNIRLFVEMNVKCKGIRENFLKERAGQTVLAGNTQAFVWYISFLSK